VGDRERVLDRQHVVAIEHRPAGLGLPDHQAVLAEERRHLAQQVAHLDVAITVKFVDAALGDRGHLAHAPSQRGNKTGGNRRLTNNRRVAGCGICTLSH
jgi:hypothetical protein